MAPVDPGEHLADRRVLAWAAPDHRVVVLRQEELAGLERMGPKSSRNLLDEVEASKARDLDALIFALGIRHVGERLAQTLARHFKTMEALASAKAEELVEVEDVGPVVARAVEFFFKQPENREFIRQLKEAGVNFALKKAATAGDRPLAGMSFVLTGTLPHLSRDEARLLIEKSGGTVTSAVSAKTTYLVVGDNPGSKLDKAGVLGVRTLTEEDFLKLTGEA